MPEKVFWWHPKLMDYRLRFFEMMSKACEVRFFFQESSSIKHEFTCIHSKQGKRSHHVPELIPCGDIQALLFNIKWADVFISSFLWNTYTIVGLICAKGLKKKVIVWEETSYLQAGLKSAIKYLLFRVLKNGVDAFYVLGEIQKHTLIKLGVNPDKVFVANEYPGYLYNKVDSQERYIPFDKQHRVVLFIGRLIEVKGVEYLMRAYRLLEQRCENVALLIVGDGPLRKHLENAAKDLGTKNVYFCGYVDDVHEKSYLFRRCSMVVVPSIITKEGHCEGGPIVVLETLSAGKPVIGTTALGSSIAFIRDGINGYIVPEKNENALYKKMKSVLETNTMSKEQILSSFNEIKGHEYQSEQMQSAIRYVLGGEK